MTGVKCFLLEPTDFTKPREVVFNDGTKTVVDDKLYIRMDTKESMTLHEAPAGAIYRATWYEGLGPVGGRKLVGQDGQSWMCVLPDGFHWLIDDRASNCTKPDDLEHNCWCRHGEAPNFTVDKNGNTCAAGAGSIASGGWHGFLQNGFLV